MTRFSNRCALALGTLSAAAFCGVLGSSLEACSSGGTGATTSPDASTATGGGDSGAGQCATPTLPIAFGPKAYSAYIQNSAHVFKLPFAIADKSIPVDANVSWTASDPSKVQINAGVGSVDFGKDTPYAAAMITTTGAGEVDIVARVGTQCGKSRLVIDAVTDQDWEIGNQRYNSGNVLMRTGNGGLINAVNQDGGAQAKCTNCHGPTATSANYSNVEHTPQQTGGFSDDELVGIFTTAMVPIGGYFDESVVQLSRWTEFHAWAMTPDQSKGIVIYLRGITPSPQTGVATLAPRDGGRGGMRDSGSREATSPEAAVDSSVDDSATDSGGGDSAGDVQAGDVADGGG